MGLLLIFTSARLLANNSGSRADFDGDGNLTQQVDPDGNTSNYRYDAQGDQTQLILGAGSSNPGTTSDSYDGDGNLTLSVNPVGDSTSYQFDADGNQTLEIDGYNTSSAATIHYLYDTDGNQTQEIDPDGNTTSYEYDTDGDQTLMIQAYGTTAAATTAYQYDNDNNLTLQTNPNGTSLSMSYDADGNLTGELWYASNGTETNSLNYTYDGDGNNLTASNDAGSYSFAYNADGEETQAVTPSGVTLNYQYDAEGNTTQITDSLGDTVTSQYDADGDLTQRDATGPGGAQANVTLGYDGDGNLTSITRQSQGQTVGSSAYTYDAQGDMTSIVHTNASGGTLDSFSYSYDAAAQLTQEVDYNSGTTDYTYDATGQLIAAGPTNYNYDANGNPNNSGDSIGSNNELLSDGTWNYSYDGNGNLIGKVGVTGGVDAGLSWSYSYDSDNELIGAKETNSQNQTLVSATYTYDVFGLRIESSVSTNGGTPVVTQFVYNGDTLWATLTGSGSLQTLYVSGDQADQYFAQIDASAGVGWYLTDHLGSVRDVMNNSGQVTDAIAYDAYGNVVSQSNPSQSLLIGYDGYQVDAAIGLNYAHYRWYNPQTGQWMSEDPLLLQPGPNPREYVNDDPTNMVDPSGEEGQWAQGWMDRLRKVDPMVYQYLQHEQPWVVGETSGGFLWLGNWNKDWSVKEGVLHIYIGQSVSEEDGLEYIQSVVRNQPGFKAFDTQANREAAYRELAEEEASRMAAEMTPSRPFNAVQNARDLAAAQPDWSEEDIYWQNLADEQSARYPDKVLAEEQANARLHPTKEEFDKAWQAWVNSGTKLNDYLDLPWKVMQTNEFQQGVRLAGAGFEAVSGVLMIVNPFVPVASQGLGMILIGHALDTAFASGASLAEGKNVQTYTQKYSTQAALNLGASQETANEIGVVADNLPGLIAVAHDGVQLASLVKNWWGSARKAGTIASFEGIKWTPLSRPKKCFP